MVIVAASWEGDGKCTWGDFNAGAEVGDRRTENEATCTRGDMGSAAGRLRMEREDWGCFIMARAGEVIPLRKMAWDGEAMFDYEQV